MEKNKYFSPLILSDGLLDPDDDENEEIKNSRAGQGDLPPNRNSIDNDIFSIVKP